MVTLLFSCIDTEGEYRDCQYHGPTIEIGLDMLNDLVRNGMQLIHVQLQYYRASAIELPVEAFDGCLVGDSLRELEREWKSVLVA